jgi:hypothetical protein
MKTKTVTSDVCRVTSEKRNLSSLFSEVFTALDDLRVAISEDFDAALISGPDAEVFRSAEEACRQAMLDAAGAVARARGCLTAFQGRRTDLASASASPARNPSLLTPQNPASESIRASHSTLSAGPQSDRRVRSSTKVTNLARKGKS